MSAFVAWSGTASYVADEALLSVVNAAIALERPLLVKGEPGTGKTLLAGAIAEGLGLPLLSWHIKSTTRAQDGLYHYDVVQRLNDSRFGGTDVSDIRRYIKKGVLGQAFSADQRVVLLIDEVDKADLEFPNDLLRELDEMAFSIPELDETVRARFRPITLITSNAEKELPDAFLRRCVFHYLAFPDRERMDRIVKTHFPILDTAVVSAAVDRFYGFRRLSGLRKPPSTSELVDWIAVLVRAGLSAEAIQNGDPFLGVLFKTEADQATATAKRRRFE